MFKNKIKSIIEKLTIAIGIDIKYLAKGGSWLLTEQTLGNLVSLLQAIAFANLISPNTYGVYSVVQSWAGIFSVFALSGLPNALMKSVAQGNEGELQKGVESKLKYGLISSLIALGFTFYYLWQGNLMLTFSFLVVSVFLPFNLAFPIVSNYLMAKGLFSKRFTIEVLVSIVSLGVMVVTLFFTNYVPYILMAYFIPSTVLYFFSVKWIIRKYQKNRVIDPETKKFALHLTGMNLMGAVYKNLDQILMFHLVGPVELAIYKFALIPIRKVQNLVQIILDIALPRYAKRDYMDFYATIGKRSVIVTAVSVLGVIGYLIVLPWAFKILFPIYMESVKYSAILALPFVLNSLSFIQQMWLAKAETKRLYFFKILGDSSRIILFLILIPLYGIAGAVGSRIIASIIVSLATVIIFLKDKKKYTSI